ncbi:MAG TPA: GNAT family N-acetyltransferase [Ignavibacteria bacterium]|nr:GNAT family N-acetyltransferase [Ignavibacteria bacterium]
MKKDFMQKLKIRRASIEDIHTILSLIKELASYEKLLDEVTATEKLLKENLFGKNKYAEVLIAEYEGKPVGEALYFHNFSTFVGKPGIYLEDIFVKPEMRGKGIGKALFSELIKIAKDRNCGRVEWVVLNWNKPAVEFYKSLDAVSIDEWTVYRLTEEKINNLSNKLNNKTEI